MASHSHHPSLSLISSSLPAEPVSTGPSFHRQSQSPFRYLHIAQDTADQPAALLPGARERCPSPRRSPSPKSAARGHRPQILPPSAFLRPRPSRALSHPRPRLRVLSTLRPWGPIILYALTSLAFLVAIVLFKTELFNALDDLAHWLQQDQLFGQIVLFLLIFLTTIPPFPLYSTLIILAGYTFGAWMGAVISYFAALSGAVVVFLASRHIFRECISSWLAAAPTMSRVVRAIEKRPRLLFLIRLAPYPYNVMNCLLAAAPTLTLSTYFTCTALSLFKVIIHTSVGASIHSFKHYHEKQPDLEESDTDVAARVWTIAGIVLCVAIFVYITIIARRAVDELDPGSPVADREEESIKLLSASEDLESGLTSPSMSESPFHVQVSFPGRV